METTREEMVMRGNCSIKDCLSEGVTTKIHEQFEGSEINICWRCGEILLKALQEDESWAH